ncbi:phage major capsid protein, HK97 family [Carnobacterium alterfunditum]|uniref:Phage major capsid protein, HK97 family n=1 Tax=Carnobacterium alterfunditum TaxID=28230 RepID=A0A1N6FRR1_9LACT|nr:phage major capsid protein [Carnobacterium alterfunditum]SIN97928.1 phage major capsid protein, HK97 family [Carnobacterium alterfunditum]
MAAVDWLKREVRESKESLEEEVLKFDRYKYEKNIKQMRESSNRIKEIREQVDKATDKLVNYTENPVLVLENTENRNGADDMTKIIEDIKGVQHRVLAPNQEYRVNNRDEELKDFSFAKMIRGLSTGNWSGAGTEQRVAASNNISNGQVMIPKELSEKIIQTVRAKSVVMQLASMIPMNSRTLTIAKQVSDFTSHSKLELDEIVKSNATFEPVNLEAKTIVASGTASVELLEDASGLDQQVIESLSASLALELDRQVLTGNGVDPNLLGIYNIEGIEKIEGGDIANYVPFSQAITKIQGKNHEPNAIVFNPSIAGKLDMFVDTLGQPIQPLPSYIKIPNKMTTTQIPNNLGDTTNLSFALVGDMTQLLVGMRTEIIIEVSRTTDNAFNHLAVDFRGYLRADATTIHDEAFVIVDGIK